MRKVNAGRYYRREASRVVGVKMTARRKAAVDASAVVMEWADNCDEPITLRDMRNKLREVAASQHPGIGLRRNKEPQIWTVLLGFALQLLWEWFKKRRAQKKADEDAAA